MLIIMMNFTGLLRILILLVFNGGQPQIISSDYFHRLISQGTKTMAREYGKLSYKVSDESSNDFQPFYSFLLDHGALWKCNDGRLICTAMPYNTEEGAFKAFNEMVEKFDYPENIKMEILDNCYKYRSSGNFMLLIYFDN